MQHDLYIDISSWGPLPLMVDTTVRPAKTRYCPLIQSDYQMTSGVPFTPTYLLYFRWEYQPSPIYSIVTSITTIPSRRNLPSTTYVPTLPTESFLKIYYVNPAKREATPPPNLGLKLCRLPWNQGAGSLEQQLD